MRDSHYHFITAPVLMLSILLISMAGPVFGSTESSDIPPVPALSPMNDYGQQDGGNESRLFQYRSMWLDGYEIVNISEIRKVVTYARDHNFNCLSPLINGNSYGVFYKSQYLPMHPDVAAGFDPLMELIKEANKYGIQVHPWWHTVYNRQMVSQNPSWAAMSSSGYTSTVWLNPALPAVKSMITNLTMEVVCNYPVGGIKLDTIRYGGSSYSYDPYSIAKFNEEGGGDFSAWRRKQITNLVEMIYGEIMIERPYIWVGADVWQYYPSWYSYCFQESREWARRGFIDYLTLMGYTTSVSTYVSNINDYLENSFDVPIIGGPYVYVPGNTAHGSVPNETVGINTMLSQVNATLDSGALGTCLFSYKFLKQWPSYGAALLEGPFAEYAHCPMKNQTHAVTDHRWEFNNDADREGWRLTDSGHYYPADGHWSITNSKGPGLMSPLLNIQADGINVIEINSRIDAGEGSVEIFWSNDLTRFSEDRMIRVDMVGDQKWRITSVHLDRHPEWEGEIRYIRVVPKFIEESNITIDYIHLSWMPDCIRTWASAGTFTMGHSEDLMDRTFIENESDLIPRLGDISGGRAWLDTTMGRDLIDLDLVYGSWEYTAAYSHVFVKSPNDLDLQMRVGSSDGIKVWINGEEILVNRGERDIGPDLNISQVSLKKGLNRIMVKLVVYRNDLSFFLRFTTLNNMSVNELEYYNDIPPLEAPRPCSGSVGWYGLNSTNITWDTFPSVSTITGYEWRLDGGEVQDITATRIHLRDLPEGIHEVEVRAVDEFGSRSDFGRCEIYIDWSQPRISTPDTGSNIIMEDTITWVWDNLFIPVSGIREYRVTISYEGRSGYYSGIISEDKKIVDRSVTLDTGIYDGYMYFISITVISNAGYSSEISGDPVLVDRKAPFPPTNPSLSVSPGSDLRYNLSWNASFDDFGSGIDHYEVWSLEGTSWIMIDKTNVNWTDAERTEGNDLVLKVRAVDRAGHTGLFSQEIRSINRRPIPVLTGWTFCSSGEYIVLSSLESYDPDGMIVRSTWSMDGLNISDLDSISLTLAPGFYTIGLWVEDDLGGISYLEEDILISDGDPNALANWLFDGSTVDVSLPPIYNITVTKNIIRDGPDNSTPVTDEVDMPESSVMLEGVIVGIAVVFCVLVISSILFVFISSSPGSGEYAEMDEPDSNMNARRFGQRINAGKSNLISVMKMRASGRNLAGDLMKSYIPSNTEYRINESSIQEPIRITVDPVDDVLEIDEMIPGEEDYILPDDDFDGIDFNVDMPGIPVQDEPVLMDIEDWDEMEDFEEIQEYGEESEEEEDWEEIDEDVDWSDEEVED